MDLPAELRAALDRVLEASSAAALARIAERQSSAYRTRTPDAYDAPVVARDDDALAYAAWRMPATYAAIAAALDALVERTPDFRPRSQLDLGSGPGTAIWAAWARLGTLERALGLERSAAFRDLAAQLVSRPVGQATTTDTHDPPRSGPHAAWRAVDLASEAAWAGADGASAGFDLVTVCYVAGELSEAARRRLLARAWAHCEGTLLVVEPGTRAGYERLMSMRDALLAAGAHVLAPCPHALPCPLAQDDWCHFAQRVARSRLHRIVKGADLGYEDEKSAYLAVAREPAPAPAPGRVLRRPEVHKAAVELSVCTRAGLAYATIPRRDKPRYRLARKLRAGDAWPAADAAGAAAADRPSEAPDPDADPPSGAGR